MAPHGLAPSTRQELDLLLTIDERSQTPLADRLEPAQCFVQPDNPPDLHRPSSTLECVGPKVLAHDPITEQTLCLRAYQDDVGGCKFLQARRDVRRLTDHDAVLTRCHAGRGHHQTRGNADSHGELDLPAERHEPLDRVDDTQTGPHGTLGVVLMRDGKAEVGQYPVAEVLGNVPVETLYHTGADPSVREDQIVKFFGVELAGDAERPDEIGEQDRNVPALAPPGRPRPGRVVIGIRIPPAGTAGKLSGLGQRRTTLPAESEGGRVDNAASRTDASDGRPAVPAELQAGRDICGTG